ncbi:MAG: MBL fold metallo-hydrolase [Parasphingorhabdus sp.]|uniref:MBL fold metallo-hydrolase n=1 Tax=Parasphingorhabdus sp. TaxID=2709688 RepID=UPI003264D748
MRLMQIVIASAVALAAIPGHSKHHAEAPSEDAVAADAGKWITLGTRGGPVTIPTRSQPANLLEFNGKKYLVDVGDGAAGQLSKANMQTAMLDGVFISHLHFDHTGGLAAILGLRFQTNARQTLTIYGPPGTQQLVDGLLDSMTPGATANYGVPGAPPKDHRAGIEVVELRDGAKADLDGMKLSVRSNTHYSFIPGSDLAKRFQALSYRFDMPGRSIVYTGDTGPSSAVEELAKDADLLVVEMMDVPLIVAAVVRNNPKLPAPAAKNMESHLTKHHLLPKDVGEMAARAGVKAVVVTHFAGAEPGNPKFFEYLKTIAEYYKGPVIIANDMDVY